MARTRGWRNVVQRQMDAYGFTPAEQRVAWTLFDVQTNIDVGAALGASPQTIKNHVYKMMLKTRTQSRLELVLVLLQLADEEPPVPHQRPAVRTRAGRVDSSLPRTQRPPHDADGSATPS